MHLVQAFIQIFHIPGTHTYDLGVHVELQELESLSLKLRIKVHIKHLEMSHKLCSLAGKHINRGWW